MFLSYFYEFLSPENVGSKPLVANMHYVITILLGYVISVKWLLPEVMKDRKPFNLRKIIVCYSFMLSFLNLVIGCQLTRLIVQTWHLKCQIKKVPLDILKAGHGVIYHGYLIRYIELVDTVFFVLRKKNNQVSFLHVFHHTFVLACFLFGLRQDFPAYYCALAVQINSFVHVVMYLYYGLAAIGPHVQKYLWWKRYLTILQITQFFYILGYAAYGTSSGCEEFTKADWFIFSFLFVLLVLFINFYNKSFTQQNTPQKQIDK